MKTELIGVIAVLAVAALVAPAAAQNVTDENATADVELSFGQQISIMVSAQQAEVENTVENAAFEIAFRENRSEAVNERAMELGGEMQEKKQALSELAEQRRNGELTEQEYTAKKMKVQAGAEELNESAENVLEKAEGLSEAEKHGVNVENIRKLANNASEMSGQEVAEVARGIAGVGVGMEHAGEQADDHRPDTPGDAADDMDGQEEERGNDEANETDEDSGNVSDGVTNGSNGVSGSYGP